MYGLLTSRSGPCAGREEKKLRTHVLIALCAMAPASGLLAQPSGSPVFTSEERDIIRRHILQERRPSITTPPDLVRRSGP